MTFWIRGAIALGTLAFVAACREQEGEKAPGTSDPTFTPDEPDTGESDSSVAGDTGEVEASTPSILQKVGDIPYTVTGKAPVQLADIMNEGDNIARLACTDKYTEVDPTKDQSACLITQYDGSYYTGSGGYVFSRLTGTLTGGLNVTNLFTLDGTPQDYDVHSASMVVVDGKPYYLVLENSYPMDVAMSTNSDYVEGNDTFNAEEQNGLYHGIQVLDADGGSVVNYIDLIPEVIVVNGTEYPVTGPVSARINPQTGDLWIACNNYASGVAEFEGERGVNYASSSLVRVSNWLSSDAMETEVIPLDGVYNLGLMEWDENEGNFVLVSTNGTQTDSTQAAAFRFDPATGLLSDKTYIEAGSGFVGTLVGSYLYASGAYSNQNYAVADVANSQLAERSIPDNGQTFVNSVTPFVTEEQGIIITQQEETSPSTIGAATLWCDHDLCEEIMGFDNAYILTPALVLTNSVYSDKPVVISIASRVDRVSDWGVYPWWSGIQVASVVE